VAASSPHSPQVSRTLQTFCSRSGAGSKERLGISGVEIPAAPEWLRMVCEGAAIAKLAWRGWDVPINPSAYIADR
jgi:hypothetical protein